MLHRLKALIPDSVLDIYHRFLSWLASAWYGQPSNELIVIGVTGTNGKTTTSYLISKVLEASGWQTGCTTTALFKIGNHEWLNDTKMTMLGRFKLQKLLRQMVDAGCRFAVIETSSQGVVQYRHAHINYDVVVFTNLTPEHLEAHGGFENYKQAKIELFRHTALCARKVFNGVTVPKIAVLNARDEASRDFAVAGLDQIVWYGRDQVSAPNSVVAKDIKVEQDRISFFVDDQEMKLNLPGLVNVDNSLASIAVAFAFGLHPATVADQLNCILGIPGRFEKIDEGQPWTVIVDYAPEPESLSKLYEAIGAIKREHLIHVLGSCGGGRDAARRPVLGKMAGRKADLVIVTNEDPYDDDPKEIMEQVADGARDGGKKDEETLWLIEDRRKAIFEAMRKAKAGDLVLITGKGCEQAICVANGKKLAWDDRTIAREAIKNIISS